MIEKSKNKPNIWAKDVVIRSILITLILIGSVISCFMLTIGNSNLMCFGTWFPSHSNLQDTAIFRFPSSASDIEYISNWGFDDCDVWVKFEMDAQDFEQFQSSTFDTSYGVFHIEAFTFDNFIETRDCPHGLDSLKAVGTDADWFIGNQRVCIDISNSDRWIVYLFTTEYRGVEG